LTALEVETAARLSAVRRVRRRAPRAVVRCILIVPVESFPPGMLTLVSGSRSKGLTLPDDLDASSDRRVSDSSLLRMKSPQARLMP
jgi:hypothetical protein